MPGRWSCRTRRGLRWPCSRSPNGGPPSLPPPPVLSAPEGRPSFEPPGRGEPARVRLAGPVTALREPEHGPFRPLRRRPEEVREELSGAAGPTRAPRRAPHNTHTPPTPPPTHPH